MNTLMADNQPRLETCPRCSSGSLEQLKTHSHCVNCNYFEEKDSCSIESVLFSLNEAEKILEKLESKKSKEKNKPAA